MRRALLSTISVLAFTVTTAVAADLPRAMPPAKAPVYAAPIYNWTGFYAGINGGYGWGDSTWDGFASSTDVSGGLVGGTVGYNWQVGALVFGVEGDIAWSDIRGSFTNANCPAGCETRNSWLGTARGRLGYAADRFMPYVTGGAAFGEVKVNPTGFAGTSDTRVGWTVGAGIEAAIARNWTAKLEYLYVDLGDVGCSALACGLPTNVDARFNVVRAGVNLRF
jgi:outer membrane immunogenic protein